MFTPEFFLILLAWAIGGGSPGPATLAISGTSMAHGRKAGVAIAAGIVAGSASWGIAAGLGMSALMLANAWVLETIRYLGAAYLLYLALKSLRQAIRPKADLRPAAATGKLFVKGMLLHLTNPKAILGWGSIYAIILPVGATTAQVWQAFACLSAVSTCVFIGYAFLFSTPRIARGYAKLKRGFDALFAALFGAASIKILTARLEV